MKRTIIALRGKGNTGKSSTLREAYDLLAGKPGVKVVSFEKIGWKVDFSAVLLVNKKKVGFYSQGDVAEWLEENLLKLKEAGCFAIVCTTRTRGKTVRVVKSFEPEYTVQWLTQLELGAPKRASGNSARAQEVIKEVDRSICA